MRLKPLIISIFATAAALHGALALADYEDHRNDVNLPNVTVALKGATVEDAVSILVPSEWIVSYQSPAVRTARITSSGEGAWAQLLGAGLRSAGLAMAIDQEAHTVTIAPGTPIMTAQAATQPGLIASAATIAAVQHAARASQVVAKASSPYKIKATDGSYSRAIQRWADEANMQLVWEDPDVDYPIRGESDYSPDIAASLTDLLISTNGSRTPLRACIHPNKPNALIRIIHKSDACDPQASL